MAVMPSPAFMVLAAARAWSSVTGAAGVGAAWAFTEPTVANVRTETIEMLLRSRATWSRRDVLLCMGPRVRLACAADQATLATPGRNSVLLPVLPGPLGPRARRVAA